MAKGLINMLIPEKLQLAGNDYYSSQDVNRLRKSAEMLENLLKNDQPNEKNKKIAEALLYQIKAKAFAIEYFDGGYLEEKYQEFSTFLQDTIPLALNAGYNKTHTILSTLFEVAMTVHSVMQGAIEEIYRVQDEDGNATTNSIDVLTEVLNLFNSKIERVSMLSDTATLFGENVRIFDIKSQAIKDLKDIADWCESAINKTGTAEIEEFFKNNVRSLDDEDGETSFSYHQPFPDTGTTSAKTIVLCTPFKDELILFTRAYAKEYKLNFVSLTAQSFTGKSQAFIEKIFQEIANRKLSCLIYGFAEYYEENEKYVIKSVIDYSLNGGIVFPVDSKGDRHVYDDFYKVVKDNNMSGMLVSYKYLAMPTYKEVITEFENKGMITGAEYEYVRKNLAFMGYVGFNKAISLFIQGKHWKDVVREISIINENEASTYLKYIPSQNQLLDIAWRDLSLDRNVGKDSKEFDYDSIKHVNPKNIEKILQKNMSIFAKCGLIARYCTLGGDDVSVWKDLNAQEKSIRLTDATRIISHILQTEYDPEVKVIPLAEWKEKGAGGLCCDGGKLILYREDCVEDYDWTIKAVTHEVFHAFQHTAVNNGWREWHWLELGVSKNRIPEWSYNFDHYQGNTSSVAYKIEIIECDARAFENDCFEKSSGIWNTIDLE